MKKSILLIACVITSFTSFSQLVINQGISPISGVQNVLLGSGIYISNVTYSGNANALGSFTTGANSPNIGLSNGLILSTGLVSEASGDPYSIPGNDNGTGSDPQLAAIATEQVYDAAVLEFDFYPLSDTIQFRYVFASEEYPEYVGQAFNDIFGFFISGINPLDPQNPYVNKNIATIPGTTSSVSINNVNENAHSQFYVDNFTPFNQYISYDGMTTVLTAIVAVVPCQSYHIKIAIGDVNDDLYDSSVFLEANSFSSNGISATMQFNSQIRENSIIEGCNNADLDVVFRLPEVSSQDMTINFQTSGNAVRNIDYLMSPNTNSVVIAAGTDTASFHIDAIQDNILDEGDTIFIIIPGIGCSNAADTIKIPIIDNSPITLNMSNDQLLCDGSGPDSIVTTPSHGVYPYSFQWNNGAGNDSVATVNPSVSTTYQVTVTDMCNNSIVDSVRIDMGSLLYSINNDTIVCSGTPLVLNSTFVGDVSWSGSASNPYSIVANQTQTYYVAMSNLCGVVNDSVKVDVYQNPGNELGHARTFCDYETYSFNLTSNVQQVDWYYSTDFSTMGNLVASGNQYTAAETGVYSIIARNGFCYDTSRVVLTFIPCEITAPNVFTPNNDGFNDALKFTNLEYYSGSSLTVYNRWGRVVYKVADYKNDWDGSGLDDGVYYYILTLPATVSLTGSGKLLDNVSGTVTILR
jgi:gliding motility-associated-like protein